MDYTLRDFSKLLPLEQDEAESIYIGAKNQYKDRESKDAIKEVERILKNDK
jgi:hypothetical protein